MQSSIVAIPTESIIIQFLFSLYLSPFADLFRCSLTEYFQFVDVSSIFNNIGVASISSNPRFISAIVVLWHIVCSYCFMRDVNAGSK